MWTEVIRRLDRRRFRAIVACLYDPGILGEQLIESGIPVYSHLASSRWDLRAGPRLICLLRREGVDLLCMINQPLTQFWGTLSGRLAGVSVLVSSIHSTGKVNRIHRRRWINQLTFPWVHRITALSESHKSYLVDCEGMDPDKIEIIPNGIDVDKFTSASRGAEVRQSQGISAEQPVIGIVAMLRPEKAHDVFLQAARLVLDQIPSARFLIVGDGPERLQLEKLTRELALEGAVRFLGVQKDVAPILDALDVAVLSSRPVVETLSVSLLECMAAGKPVVATRVGSLAELVEEGKSGFLVEPGDWEAMAGRILQLIQDRSLAGRMGQEGRQKVRKHYTLEQVVKQTEAFFEKLLTQQKGLPCASS